ncbi:hypothetical protein JCGZ_25496 [Jatropha curcas]|uniref:NB-ARC domain-containing protein n=1 Tax=Jatropha curcas TaxID=180498 RepID=A0A067JLB3_JATCU|nr:hypothetical protein JCGZ_25496 [Jatropha curcas]
MAIDHAQGIPLAIKVLGSNLYGKSEEVWVDELEQLKGVSDEKIKHILRISYDGLRENEKEIFLAIACMFKGEDKHRVESLLDVPGSKFGISRLVDRSLITITVNQLHMHDLLQQIGEDIVREEKQFGKRGWLWDPKDIYYLFTRAEGTEAIKGISLDMSTAKELNLKPTAFEKMYNLKFLKFYASLSKIKVYLPKGLSFLPEELRLLHWYQFPLKSLPLGSYVENLVELRMHKSKLKELCSGVQQLGNLKFVNLSHSKELIRVPDLSKAAKLEFLDLSYCESLVEIPSPEYLSKLTRLHLTKCDSLCTLPSLLDLKSLKEFRASECLKLAEFPEFPCNVEELVLQRTRIEKVPPSIGSLSRLSSLDLSDCTMLESLPDSICNLKSLMDFQITGCVNLKRLPENIGNLESLGGLNAINSGLIELPDSICNLRKLRTLLVGNCANLHSVPEKLGDLESLTALHLGGIRIKGLLSSVNLWRQLTFIKLESCGLSEFPSCLCHSDSSLEYLLIGGNNFESIPDCIKQLSMLLYLSFGQCKRLKYLPSELPSLSKLFNIFGDNCTSLKSASSLFQLDNIVTFAFANCFNLDLGKCNEFVDHLLATPLASRKTIFYPGNELPQTMMYQNTCGYSLTLSSSSKQCERVQFCLCVVIDPKFLGSVWHGVSSIGYTVYIFTNETLKELGYLEVKEFIPPRYEVFYPESSEGFVLHSEHVVFWSERIELPLDNKKTVFEFYALDMENRRNYNAIVKCGVHHHLRFSNVVGEEDEVEEEEKRKTKRLRML